LDRITQLFEALGDPQRSGRFVHVAGTNGKGSTCAMIEAGCARGVRTGIYTSPHLIEPTERIQSQAVRSANFNSRKPSPRYIEHRSECWPLATWICIRPTSKQWTAMAFLLFARERADVVVLEVGMGGRLDANKCGDAGAVRDHTIDFDTKRSSVTNSRRSQPKKPGS